MSSLVKSSKSNHSSSNNNSSILQYTPPSTPKRHHSNNSSSSLSLSSLSCAGGGGDRDNDDSVGSNSSPSGSIISGSTGKCTVREVKKRSKNNKSRTLPGRLKLLHRRSSSGDRNNSSNNNTNNNNNNSSNNKSPTPPSTPNLSIFKLNSGQHWCLDMDAYGIYMDHNDPNLPHISSHSEFDPYKLTCHLPLQQSYIPQQQQSLQTHHYHSSQSQNKSNDKEIRSKSLTRADAEKAAANRKRNMSSKDGCNSGGRSRSRSRSRSRLSNSVFSVSQCFGLSSSPPVQSLQSSHSRSSSKSNVNGRNYNDNMRQSKDNLDNDDDNHVNNFGDDDNDDDLSDCYCAAKSLGSSGPTSELTSITITAPPTPSNSKKSSKSSNLTGKKSISMSSRNLLRVEQNYSDYHNDYSSSFEFLDYDDEDEERYYPSDTSYDKACGSEQRRGSAPLTPLLGRETPSRFANFFSKRSFKSNPLKRTKSVTKLERKKPPGTEPESNLLYPPRLRTSRSHESLLAWTNNPHSLNNFVNNGMMSTVDLTAGDVAIRPLHPSILGQDYAFQVITPSGSKYYSCSSGPERDAWVHALRQAIKPHSDEIRRQENSLKLWILEAKGMPGGSGKHSKRFFCELYLDDVLYARTCAKPKGELLFWGENFDFSQLPNCVQLITVVFFREGDKKRKKERNTCIGKVKIPVSTVNSRYLIEKWYPVIPDSGSSQTLNKDSKDGPSLRIKCKFQSVDILPLRCYRTFLQYIKDEYGPVSDCLESVLSVKAKEDLASAMVHVLHHEGLAKDFIGEIALNEILKSGDEKLTFRGNSIATKSMEAFLKLTGTEYLHATLGPFIEQFQNAEEVYDCEIDPLKIPQASTSTLNKNQQNLRMAIDTVWKSILHSHSMFPMELRECFAHCREALKSAGKEELSDHLISASIFLRFLCPAILSPSLFSLHREYPSEKSARNLTLVAKVLQTLANFTRFQGKENYMEFINDFVEREAGNMKAFLSRISSPLNPEVTKRLEKENQDKVPAGGFIDLGKHLSILSTLLSESVAKIAPMNDRFKQLQEILENIHLWLKQPANATNVPLLPFPHLTSPPTCPPPPAPIGLHHNIHIVNHLNQNPGAINHQYQVPHSNIINNNPMGNPVMNGINANNNHHSNNNSSNNSSTNNTNSAMSQPIYAVSNVIHNTSNPNVKNISQVHIPPLQLQIPVNVNSMSMSIQGLGLTNNNNPNRSGSQASSGYQSGQSPVLEEGSKNNKSVVGDNGNINNININNNNNIHSNSNGKKDIFISETNSGEKGSNHHQIINSFNRNKNASFGHGNNGSSQRKSGSQSVDDLSSFGIDQGEDLGFKKRLTRSSSSSDCEYAPTSVISNNKNSKIRSSPGQQKGFNYNHVLLAPGQHQGNKLIKPKSVATPHHRLSRRSSAELLRKNHPYSSSTDEDSDSNGNGKEDIAPQLPPRRSHGNSKRSSANSNSNGRNSGQQADMNGSLSSNGDKSLEEYEIEMQELRRAMEQLQLKLNRAEERLFGHDSPSQTQSRRESDLFLPNAPSPNGSTSGARDRLSLKSADENAMEMDHLLARLLSAEEEMKREQDLLSALDKKQKLIDAQEQKIARLDAVNNQLLGALAQIRDSLQQQHVQAHQKKIELQLQKLKSSIPSNNNNISGNRNITSPNFNLHNNSNNNNNNNNNNSISHMNGNIGMNFGAQPQTRTTINNNNTTKVLITSDSSGESGNVSPTMSLEMSISSNGNNNESTNGNQRPDSSTFLGEQALKMLAELKSSSC